MFVYVDIIVFVFDGDVVGIKVVLSVVIVLLEEMCDGKVVKFFFLFEGKDLDEFVCVYGIDVWCGVFNDGVLLSMFLVGYVM